MDDSGIPLSPPGRTPLGCGDRRTRGNLGNQDDFQTGFLITSRGDGTMPHWPDCSTERPGQPRSRTTKPTTTRGEKGPGSVTGAPTTFKNRRLSAIEPEELESSIREAYFAIASWVAIRYDVEIDEVIKNLIRDSQMTTK